MTFTINELLKPDLASYAQELKTAGFTIYISGRPWIRRDGTPMPMGHFTYARAVGDEVYYGHVQEGEFPLVWTALGGRSGENIEHHMPIRPSAEHGSSMWINGPTGPRTVQYAEAIASPGNSNPLVGWHANYEPDGIKSGRLVAVE